MPGRPVQINLESLSCLAEGQGFAWQAIPNQLGIYGLLSRASQINLESTVCLAGPGLCLAGHSKSTWNSQFALQGPGTHCKYAPTPAEPTRNQMEPCRTRLNMQPGPWNPTGTRAEPKQDTAGTHEEPKLDTWKNRGTHEEPIRNPSGTHCKYADERPEPRTQATEPKRTPSQIHGKTQEPTGNPSGTHGKYQAERPEPKRGPAEPTTKTEEPIGTQAEPIGKKHARQAQDSQSIGHSEEDRLPPSGV